MYNVRSSRENFQGHGWKPANAKTDPVRISPLAPPPSSKKPVFTDSGFVDYLSGDAYKSEGFSKTSEHTSHAVSTNSHSSSNALNSSSSPLFTAQPVYDEPAPISKSADQLHPAPLESQSPGFLPPPPSKHNQRQQFFEQQSFPSGGSQTSSGSSSYDSLVGQTQNLSLNSSAPTKQVKQEDALFKDLVDFAKAKSSSPSKSNRSF